MSEVKEEKKELSDAEKPKEDKGSNQNDSPKNDKTYDNSKYSLTQP